MTPIFKHCCGKQEALLKLFAAWIRVRLQNFALCVHVLFFPICQCAWFWNSLLFALVLLCLLCLPCLVETACLLIGYEKEMGKHGRMSCWLHSRREKEKELGFSFFLRMFHTMKHNETRRANRISCTRQNSTHVERTLFRLSF